MHCRPAIALFLALFVCTPSQRKAETSSGPKPAPAPSDDDAAFDPDHVIDVSITMADDDWLALRTKGRDASTLATECRQPAAKIYPYYNARMSVDGVALSDVEVRKKGFLGSLSVLRPSLKLRLAAVAKDQRYRGVKRMTLNNNRQDAALMRKCLAYKVFRDAGHPAPRCNHARVTVNGNKLGIYSNVEPIKNPFLRRHFGDDGGTLFEGNLPTLKQRFLETSNRRRARQTERRSRSSAKSSRKLPPIFSKRSPRISTSTSS